MNKRKTSVALDKSMIDDIKRIAQANRRGWSDMMRLLLEEAINKRNQEK